MSTILELLLELGFQGIRPSREGRDRVHPVIVGAGVLLFGALAGALTTWLVPTRLLGAPLVPGASLVLSPVLNGVLLRQYGAWRARRHLGHSFIATFWGGALFGFGFALMRFLLVAQA